MESTRSRLGVVAIVGLAIDSLVHAWDWLSRIAGLDPYFGAEKDTAWGHILAFVFGSLPMIGLAVALVFGLLWSLEPWFRSRSSKRVAEQQFVPARNTDLEHALATATTALNEATKARDDAQLEASALKLQLDDRNPRFISEIVEIQLEDPSSNGKDLNGVILISIGNNGAKSVARSFKISARAVNGTVLECGAVSTSSTMLKLNNGSDEVTYTSLHFIVDRTYDKPIERGVPVFGALPCVFFGVTDAATIDLRSIKVMFTDGISFMTEKPYIWETRPFDNPTILSNDVRLVRFGMPAVLPVGKR